MQNLYLLSPQEASEQYQKLLDEHLAPNTTDDKGRTLRTRVEHILKQAFNPAESLNLQRLIDLVGEHYDSPRATELCGRLHYLRTFSNTRLVHTYEEAQRGRSGIGRRQYIRFLATACDLVCYLSGSPIPSQLLLAIRPIRPLRQQTDEIKLDVVILLQLFCNYQQVSQGAHILSEFQQMLVRKDELGLKNVHFHLITYSCPLFVQHDIGHPDDLQLPGDNVGLIDEVALGKALNYISELPKPSNSQLRPWLMWLNQSNETYITDDQVLRLEQMYKEHELAFYPIPLNDEALQFFQQRWPKCRPDKMSPRLASNFFNSILLTIQRLFEQKS